MQTQFSPQQLADPATAASEQVIRKCVHCGFCTATCPTYVLLGDELDSPRGRIYLIKDMLENEREPTAKIVKHIDRCLSCLSCMTTCPSGVNYMHLVDHARSYIEERYRRPWPERVLRATLAAILPYPRRFRAALFLAKLGRPLTPLLKRLGGSQRLVAMLELANSPPTISAPLPPSRTAAGSARGKVVLLRGCVENTLEPQIRSATMRLLEHAGYEIVDVAGEGCCGALVQHLGREPAALAAARRNVDAWSVELDKGLRAITTTASGCGTSLKDYGFLLRDDPAYAAKAARVSACAQDISELLHEAGLSAPARACDLTIAYHPACSLQHGQAVRDQPRHLLRAAGYKLVEIPESHLCCGSAGTYNIMQPQIAAQLRARKLENIDKVRPDVIATGNIGCIRQIAAGTDIPVVHIVELLDWAAGGLVPAALARTSAKTA